MAVLIAPLADDNGPGAVPASVYSGPVIVIGVPALIAPPVEGGSGGAEIPPGSMSFG